MIDLSRVRGDFRDLDGCPHCGAHRWEQDRRLALLNFVRCGECAHECWREDVRSVVVGRD